MIANSREARSLLRDVAMRRADASTSASTSVMTRSEAVDPRSVLCGLLQAVRPAVARLEVDAVRSQNNGAVERWNIARSCERELLLVAEAVGYETRVGAPYTGHIRSAMETIVDTYAAALTTELPRPVRAVLDNHLRRLRVLSTRERVAA